MPREITPCDFAKNPPGAARLFVRRLTRAAPTRSDLGDDGEHGPGPGQALELLKSAGLEGKGAAIE